MRDNRPFMPEASILLHESSKITLQDFLVSLNVLKTKHNMSDLVIKDILELFSLTLPKPNNVPKNNKFVEKKMFNTDLIEMAL